MSSLSGMTEGGGGSQFLQLGPNWSSAFLTVSGSVSFHKLVGQENVANASRVHNNGQETPAVGDSFAAFQQKPQNSHYGLGRVFPLLPSQKG